MSFKYTLDYIGLCKSSTVLLENVVGLTQKPKDNPDGLSDADFVLQELRRLGYHGAWHTNKARSLTCQAPPP